MNSKVLHISTKISPELVRNTWCPNTNLPLKIQTKPITGWHITNFASTLLRPVNNTMVAGVSTCPILYFFCDTNHRKLLCCGNIEKSNQFDFCIMVSQQNATKFLWLIWRVPSLESKFKSKTTHSFWSKSNFSFRYVEYCFCDVSRIKLFMYLK